MHVNKTVYEVSNEMGRVIYYKDIDEFYLAYHVPQTYDMELRRVVCNMPEGFPKRDDYVEVQFTGSFKEQANSISEPLGYGTYVVELGKIVMY